MLQAHVKIVMIRVPVMKTQSTCHGAFYKRRAKNAANCASARNPIDFVSAAGLVMVHQI